MHAFSTAGWENFFVAEVGAAAALTGLLFVAVSINLKEILSEPQLPGRAAEALFILMGVLVTATLGLVPAQSSRTLGTEVVAVGAVVWAFPIKLQMSAYRPGSPIHWMATRVLTHQLATLPWLVGGVSLLLGAGGGLYWLVLATILSFAAAVVNSWVLLIEIQR